MYRHSREDEYSFKGRGGADLGGGIVYGEVGSPSRGQGRLAGRCPINRASPVNDGLRMDGTAPSGSDQRPSGSPRSFVASSRATRLRDHLEMASVSNDRRICASDDSCHARPIRTMVEPQAQPAAAAKVGRPEEGLRFDLDQGLLGQG